MATAERAHSPLNHPMGLFLLGLLFVVLCVAAWPFTIDDAFIVARYGRQLADGTYGYNTGVVTDGVTGPLWLLPAWGAAIMGRTVPGVLKCTGALFYLAAMWITWRGAQRRAQSGALIAASVIAVSSSGAVWAVGGLETGLATCLLSILACAGWTRQPARWSAFALLLLPAVRPDLIPAAWVLAAAGQHRRIVFIAGTAGLLGVVLFRLVMFGTLLPLSFAAKGSSVAHGIEYVSIGVLFVFLPALPWLVVAVIGRVRRARWLISALVIHLVSVAAVGGDWMPGHRLLVPLLPVVGLLAGAGFLKQKRDQPRASWLMVALAVPAAVLLLMVVVPAARASGGYQETGGRSLVDALTETDSQGPVALIDIGYVGFETGLPMVDLAGITDPDVARMAGNHVDRNIDMAFLDARAPTQIVLHSASEPVVDQGMILQMNGYPTENRLAAHEWVRTRFLVSHVVAYAPDYWYIVLRRQ